MLAFSPTIRCICFFFVAPQTSASILRRRLRLAFFCRLAWHSVGVATRYCCHRGYIFDCDFAFDSLGRIGLVLALPLRLHRELQITSEGSEHHGGLKLDILVRIWSHPTLVLDLHGGCIALFLVVLPRVAVADLITGLHRRGVKQYIHTFCDVQRGAASQLINLSGCGACFSSFGVCELTRASLWCINVA